MDESLRMSDLVASMMTFTINSWDLIEVMEFRMECVWIILGIIFGILILFGLVFLIQDMMYYRRKEREDRN